MRILLVFLIFGLSLSIHAESVDLGKEVDCVQKRNFGFESLATNVLKVVADKKGFVESNGVKVHQSCLDNFGGDFLPLLNSTYEDGISCMENLGGAGSAKNAAAYRELLASKKLSIICNEKDYHWETAIAHATGTEDDSKPEIDFIHPGISIAPDAVLENPEKKGSSVSRDILRATLFHEPFHNLGYKHVTTPDYAYACEECCISHNSIEQREAACKICKTEYKGFEDPNYVKDLLIWNSHTAWSRQINARMAIRKGLVVNPGSEVHIEGLLSDMKGNDIVSKFFAESLIKEGKSKSLYIKKVSEKEIPKDLSALFPIAQEAASIREKLYIRGDVAGAVEQYLKFDSAAFKNYFSTADPESKNYDLVLNLWDAVLYDMDSVYSTPMYANYPNKKAFDDKYDEIVRSKPKKTESTNQ